jgi:hypothetical protein
MKHRLVASGLAVALLASCSSTPHTSVWVENRSGNNVVLFVTDLSSLPEACFVVPANSAATLGSAGLGNSPSHDVRVNVLGWRHEVGNVGPCSPGDYDDTVYDVPPGASVRLLIEPSGEPSVSITPEPSDLPAVAEAPLGGMSEAELCAAL